jgi:hypothetical protein
MEPQEGSDLFVDEASCSLFILVYYVLWQLIRAAVADGCACSGWVEQVPWTACAQGAGEEARPGHPDYKVSFF